MFLYEDERKEDWIMGKFWRDMLEHPIATWIVVGVLTNAVANIVSVAKGGRAVPIVNITKSESTTESK